MRVFLAILLTTTYGIILRLSQDWFSHIFSLMSTTFVFLSPILIGALTILLIPYQKIKSPIRAFFIPWITALAILGITYVFNLEGMVCWVMVFPLFAIGAGIGGRIVYHFKKKRFEKTFNGNLINNKIDNSFNISLAIVIPFLAGFIEGDKMIQLENIEIKETIIIDRGAASVWNAIIYKDKENLEKNQDIISAIMRFPKQLSTQQDFSGLGGTRTVYYEDSLKFTEKITTFDTNKKLVLSVETIKNRKEKTKDVQMLLSSKFFNIQEDIYELEKMGEHKTKLSLTSKLKVNTPFNWYSKIWVDLFMSSTLGHELEKINQTLAHE